MTRKGCPMNAEYLIEKLGLQQHPEGGYYRETYRCQDLINTDNSLIRYDTKRNASTAIYYLLKGQDFSAFHRLKSDEILHFYSGSSLIIHLINPQGEYIQKKLGSNLANEETFQIVINHGDWFASQVGQPDSYSLIGCTVSPGFDFADFELGNRDELGKLYPQHQTIIHQFTRD